MSHRRPVIFVSLILAAVSMHAEGQESLRQTISGMLSPVSSAPASATIEWGFSPEGTALSLVLKVIRSARRSIHVMAYVMSNGEISGALAQAARSGVAVSVQVDEKENVVEDHRGYIRSRLSELVRAGAAVCAVDAFPSFHDKVIVVDGLTVETGSFNFSQAANRNSENAIVLWDSPQVANAYEQHFRARAAMCLAYQSD